MPNVPLDEVTVFEQVRLAAFGAVQTTITEKGAGYVKLAYEDIDAELEPGTDAAALAGGAACYTPLRAVCEAGDVDAAALAHTFPAATPPGSEVAMSKIGVVLHQQKTLGAGPEALRMGLADAGYADPPWSEVPKSRKAPKEVRRLLDAGIDRLLVWGGDGMVRRCIDTLVKEDADVELAILPAGTANLLAKALSIPIDLDAALDVALHGAPPADRCRRHQRRDVRRDGRHRVRRPDDPRRRRQRQGALRTDLLRPGRGPPPRQRGRRSDDPRRRSAAGSRDRRRAC